MEPPHDQEWTSKWGAAIAAIGSFFGVVYHFLKAKGSPKSDGREELRERLDGIESRIRHNERVYEADHREITRLLGRICDRLGIE